MNEFLKSLYAEGLLYFCTDIQAKPNQASPVCPEWQWSIEQIQARGITDNVVDLMAGKLQRLKRQTCELLKVAACIGNQFDLELLSVAIAAPSQQKKALALREVIAEGLILPLNDMHRSIELDVPLPLANLQEVY